MKGIRRERLRFKIGDRFYRTYFPDQKGIIIKISPPYFYKDKKNHYRRVYPLTGKYFIYARMDGTPPNHKAVLYQSGITKIK